MIWDSIIKSRPVNMSAGSSAKFSTLDPRVLAKMQKFQKNIDMPVYLAGGTPDKILFTVTCVLVIAGVGRCFKLFYDMANPKP